MRALQILKILALISILMAVICNPAPASSLRSEFICNNKDAITTYYTYLKEPKLQDSGYTRGMKTGSFNYFYNGDVALRDTMEYYDGLVDAKHPSGGDHNSTIDHRLDVDFVGEKGISTYYSQGFFPNNRAVSAGKKIYYIDYSNKSWNLGGIYKSDKISVRGYTKMGANLPNAFAFWYNGQVENGVMEVSDATGWSNKTGARRIDWEQDALMKGSFLNVTNNLIVERGLYLTKSPEDWLPCCFDSLRPPVEPKGGVWPSSSVKSVLASGSHVKSCFKGAVVVESKQDLEEFFQGIDVTSTLSLLDQQTNEAGYLVKVQNKYSVPVEKLVLTMNLAPGMKYESYSYGNGTEALLSGASVEPNPTDTDDLQVLQWGWEGGMRAKSEIAIFVKANTKGECDVSNLEKTTAVAKGLKDGDLVSSGEKGSSVNIGTLV